jgi:hypothetical protein
MSLIISFAITGVAVVVMLDGITRWLGRRDWQSVLRAEAAEREKWRGSGWRRLDPAASAGAGGIRDDLRLLNERDR